MGNVKKFIYHSQPTISKKDVDSVTKLLKTLHLEDGSNVIEIENRMKTVYNKKYAIAVNTGFASIHLSLIGYNIKEGDEVIIPTYSCPALLNPILIQKAKPVLIDTQKNGFNISFKDLKSKINKHTKLIILPYMFGFPTNIKKILDLNIPVIEDVTLSLGGKYKNRLLGTFSDTMICSFYATKMITGGDGGMLLTNDKKVYEIAKNYRYYGHQKQHKYLAYNYHTTNLPMSLALSQFNQLNDFISKRKKLANLYDKLLKEISEINIEFKNKKESVFYRYLIRLKTKEEREQLKQYLKENGIGTGYGVLEGLHELIDTDYKYPNATKHLNTILSLPIYPNLKKREVKYIVSVIRKFYKGKK